MAGESTLARYAEMGKGELAGLTEKYKSQLAVAREKLHGTAGVVQRAATVAAGGFILGKIAANYSKSNTAVPTLFDMDWQLTWGAGGLLLGHFLGGRWGEILQDAASAALAVYAYEQAQR